MKCRVAVVGSGVAGLSAAWYLSKKHHVTLFEKKPSVGMGSEGFVIPNGEGDEMRMDIPPRVMNRAHYKAMFSLLDEAGIDTIAVRQHPSFSTPDGKTYLGFHTVDIGGLALSLPKILTDTGLWFFKHGIELAKWFLLINDPKLDDLKTDLSLRPYLRDKGFSDDFISGFLYPLWALICTCDYQSLDRFPVRDMMVILRNFAGRSPSQRIKGGTASFERKMKEKISDKRFGESVQKIENDDPEEKVRVSTDQGQYEFDHVVIATEPFFAAKMLGNSYERERNIISKIPWYETQMVLHKDTNLMPKKRGRWAPVNLFWDREQEISWATLWMNRLEAEDPSPDPILQSWDPVIQPAHDKVLATRTFKRVLSTDASQKLVADLNHSMKTDPQRRLWFVGSYMTKNIPLLENGVVTARRVAQLINQGLGPGKKKTSRRHSSKAHGSPRAAEF